MSDNQQFCLRWNNHQSTLVQVIDSLLSSGVLVDCTLAAEGQFLNAHKVVLCACSPYLEALLSQHYEKHPIVILKDVKFQELKSMMDYMYKGEVNISQDQLGQFLKAAESLQIKGLTDGGGENDSRDVGSTSQKRHEPTPVRKTAVPHQSRSPLVLPSHSTGLTIEPSKRTLPTHLSESQPDSPIRSREGSSSPTSRKRRRQRRPSQGDEDGHQDNSCDLPMQAQTMSITTVPTSIPPIPTGSSSTITKAPPPDDDSENPENDRLSGIPADGFIKEKIEPQPEMLIEPKTEYMEETNNDDSVEDLTLDDDDDYENMMEGGPGPSHSANNPNENYAAWQQMTGDRQDEAYLNPADTGHRDSQDTDAGHAASVPFSSATNLLFSSRLRRALLKRQRKQFFYRLPFEKQLTLLKRLENINRDSNDEVRKLAVEEGVNAGKLIGWISVKRVLPSTDTVNEVSAEKIAMLAEEFELLPELSESRAILLSDLLYITVPVIRELFEEFRTTRSAGALKSPSKYTVASQRLTPEQYKVLAARFKPSVTVLKEEADQRASEAGLNVFQVCSWLSIHERKMKQSTMQPIVQNLSKGWRSDQLVELERQFRKKVSISRKRAVELSRIFGKRVAEVLLWFQNRRLYELYKEHGTCRSVQKKLKYVRDILDANDLDAVAAMINLRKFSPSVTVPRCSVVGDQSASELETTTRNSEDVSVESDATVDLQDQENTPPTQQNPLAVQNTLFEEFKKSSVLDPERRRLLQNRLQIPAYRINAYFSKLSARLAGASESDLKKILTSQPAAFLTKIATEYRRNRYISVMKSQTLSKQLRASRRVIDNWFSNARLYEQLTGDRSIAGTFREEPDKSATPSSESARKLPVPVSQPKEVESCVNSIRELIKKSSVIKPKEQPKKKLWCVKAIRTVTDNMAARLRQEMDTDPLPTEERVVTLARKYHLGKSTIRSWIEENTPSKSGCDGTSVTEITADKVSTPTVLTVAANETTDELATSTSAESSKAKSTGFPHEIMFYAFKQNPHAFKQQPYDLAFVADITSKTNRPLSLIKDWFVRMNRRLSGLKDDLLRSEYRNANLTEDQVRVLEAEFQRRPYESIKHRTALADQLWVTKTDIAEWFMKQRLYALLCSTLQTDVSKNVDVSSTIGGSGDVEVDEEEKRTVRRSGRIAVDAEVEPDKTEQLPPRRSARKSVDTEVEADKTEEQTVRRSARISVGAEVESDKTEQRPSRQSTIKSVDAEVESDETEKVIRRSIRTSVVASRLNRSADEVVVLDDSSDEDSDSISPIKLDDSSIQTSASNVCDHTLASDVSKVSKCCAPYCLCSMLGESCASESSCQSKKVSFGETSVVNTVGVPKGVSLNARSSRSVNLPSPSDHSDFDVATDEDLPLQCLVENGQSQTSTKLSEVNKKKVGLTSHQRQILLDEFNKSPFVSDSKARMLAKDLNVPVKVVELWYRNRRLKFRPMRSPKSKKPEPAKADPCANLSEFQLFVLEREYCKDPKLVKTRVHRIAKKLKIQRTPIVAYFQKRASENSK